MGTLYTRNSSKRVNGFQFACYMFLDLSSEIKFSFLLLLFSSRLIKRGTKSLYFRYCVSILVVHFIYHGVFPDKELCTLDKEKKNFK